MFSPGQRFWLGRVDFLYRVEGNFGPNGRNLRPASLLAPYNTRPRPDYLLAPSPPARKSEERCKIPQRGPVLPAAKQFSRVLNVQSGLFRQFSVVYCSLFHSNNFCQGTVVKERTEAADSVASTDATALVMGHSVSEEEVDLIV